MSLEAHRASPTTVHPCWYKWTFSDRTDAKIRWAQGEKRKGTKGTKGTDINPHRHHLPTQTSTSVSSPYCRLFGWNFPTLVVSRKSITDCSQSSMENSSELSMWVHQVAFQPIAYPTALHGVFCWCLHGLKWQTMCFHIWAPVLHPLRHHQHWSSSWCLNYFV